jgi:hypothetical protein
VYTVAQQVGYATVDVRDSGEALAYFTRVQSFEAVEDCYFDCDKSWILVAPPGAQRTNVLELCGAPPHDAQLNYFQIVDDTAGRSSAPTSATRKSQCECIQRTGQTYSSRAITDQCACTITHPGPRTLNGCSILTQPSVGRS